MEDPIQQRAENEEVPLFVLRTITNKEEQVIDYIADVAKRKKLKVYSILHPHGLRGYVYIEAESYDDAYESTYGVPYSKGLLKGTITYKEISASIEESKQEISIKKKDVVEIISGPFKREQARVIRIDNAKNEVIVELLESATGIPITLPIDAVKVIRRDEEETLSE